MCKVDLSNVKAGDILKVRLDAHEASSVRLGHPLVVRKESITEIEPAFDWSTVRPGMAFTDMDNPAFCGHFIGFDKDGDPVLDAQDVDFDIEEDNYVGFKKEGLIRAPDLDIEFSS